MVDTLPTMEPPSLEGYTVLESLGPGCTGEAFTAQTDDGLNVVLKVIDPARGQLLPTAARLVDEEIHPAIARVLALGEDDQGRGCLVLDRLDGEPLGARAVAGLPKWTVVHLLRQIAEGLAALHDAGAAHANLKPDNILVRRDEETASAFVCDTGLLIRGDVEQPDALPGMAYLAPERLRTLNEQLGQAEPRPEEDVYSFAVMVAETLSGKQLFAGNETASDLLDAKESRSYRLVGTTAAGGAVNFRRLDEVLRRALSTEPTDRPTDWSGFLDALTPRS